MIRHGKILVATDFSEQAGEALRRAVVLAEKLDAEIHLLHALEEIVMYDAENLLPVPNPELMDSHRKGAEQRLAKQLEQVPYGVVVHTAIRHVQHSPAATICEEARDLDADMIVVGCHGHEGFFDHLLAGATAEHVVRHAPCSVLVTKLHGLLADKEEG